MKQTSTTGKGLAKPANINTAFAFWVIIGDEIQTTGTASRTRDRPPEQSRNHHVDTVFIRGLRVETRIGVHAWEQRIRQVLRVDVELAVDAARAAASDDIGDAVDYAQVAERLRALGEAQSWKLVETYAERAAAAILETFDTPWVRVAVTKAVRLAQRTEVGVVVERGQRRQSNA